jgi:hypothetical protein
MSRSEDLWRLQRSITTLELSVAFSQDRETLGLGAAVERLRLGLKTADLWLGAQDELLMGQILSGSMSVEEICDALDPVRRTGTK